MNKLITKARSGVTLVELLVVVLIVTILSVSLLPLLKPFVVEAQYAAEAIPVIANLRTKIALYQYNNGPLPTWNAASTKAAKPGGVDEQIIETWGFSSDGQKIAKGGPDDPYQVTDLYAPGYRICTDSTPAGDLTEIAAAQHQYTFGKLIDVNNQELVGKRCKPVHFQYSVVSNGANYCYCIGCFGDDNGLPSGTGYAVCEICLKTETGKVFKQIGTWKRYKAATEGQLLFKRVNASPAQATADKPGENKDSEPYCPIPALDGLASENDDGNGLKIVQTLREWGWEF